MLFHICEIILFFHIWRQKIHIWGSGKMFNVKNFSRLQNLGEIYVRICFKFVILDKGSPLYVETLKFRMAAVFLSNVFSN